MQIKNAILKAVLYHPIPFLSMKTIKGGKSLIHMQAIAEMKKMQRKQHKLSLQTNDVPSRIF